MSASTSQSPLTCYSSTGTVAPPSLLLATQSMCQWRWILAIFPETASPKIPRRSLTSHNRFVCGCACTSVGVIHQCTGPHQLYLESRLDLLLYHSEWAFSSCRKTSFFWLKKKKNPHFNVFCFFLGGGGVRIIIFTSHQSHQTVIYVNMLCDQKIGNSIMREVQSYSRQTLAK